MTPLIKAAGKALDLVVLGNAAKPEPVAAVKVTPAASVPEKAMTAQFVSGRAPETTVPGAALIPDRAPSVVAEAVTPPFSWRKTGNKVLGQVVMVAWSVLLPLAADALLDHALRPGFLDDLGLPPSVPVPIVYAALAALRDYRRHKREASK